MLSKRNHFQQLSKINPVKFHQAVIDWFIGHGRNDLPWQQNPTAYRVWVSEIMLQQTQVNTVIPYYLKFLQRFPTLIDLASASEDQVLALWSGLGYYSRARNLHKTAIILNAVIPPDPHSDQFPKTSNELQNLPGIGRSTAGAILTLAMNKKAPILDGNVKRVLARCFKIQGWPGKTDVAKKLWSLAEILMPNDQVQQYTQGMMDLGATICTRSKPACVRCPVEGICGARAENSQSDYPGKKKQTQLPIKQQYFFLLRSETAEILMQKRPPSGIWGGLWTPPSCNYGEDIDAFLHHTLGISLSKMTMLDDFRHTFSHFHLQIYPVQAKITHISAIAENNLQWNSINHWLDQGIPAPVRTMLMTIRED